MKTVTGKVVSSKPISLSTAAKNLSGFTSLEENGASDAVRAYLKRASDAFNRLVQFHKELKGSHSHRIHKPSSQRLDFDSKIETLATDDKNPDGKKIKNVENKGKLMENRDFEVNNEGPLKIEQGVGRVHQVKVEKSSEKKGKDKVREFELNNEDPLKIEKGEDGVDEDKGERSLEKKRKDRKLDLGSEVREEIGRSPDGAGEKRKKKKHRKIEGNEDGEESVKGRDNAKQESVEVEREIHGVEGGSTNRKDKKNKKKRKKSEGEEDEESFGVEEGKEKRKSMEVDGGERSDLAEQSGKKKKKRRKTEG